MKNHAGFTLVEIVVSILIFSFMSAGLYGMLELGRRSYMRDITLLQLGQQARVGMDRIIRDVRASSNSTVTVVTVDRDRISFNTPTATGVMYYLSGTTLIREYPAGTIRNVASGISRLKFTKVSTLLTISMNASGAFYQGTMTVPLVEEVRLRNE